MTLFANVDRGLVVIFKPDFNITFGAVKVSRYEALQNAKSPLLTHI
jgi:hypothetical protein